MSAIVTPATPPAASCLSILAKCARASVAKNAAFFSAHPLPALPADAAPHVWEAGLAPDADALDRADVELAHDEDDDEDESEGESEEGEDVEGEGGEGDAALSAAEEEAVPAAALKQLRSPKRGRSASKAAR